METIGSQNKGYRAEMTVVTYCLNRTEIDDKLKYRVLLVCLVSHWVLSIISCYIIHWTKVVIVFDVRYIVCRICQTGNCWCF